MGVDAGEPLDHIFIRKEAERTIGGEWWWGLGSTVAKELEQLAISNGGTLPPIFSALNSHKGLNPNQKICVWNGWRSRDGNRNGPIPEHVLVLSAYNPKPERREYALVCRSGLQVVLGNHGHFNPVNCLTPSGKMRDPRQRTTLLMGSNTHPDGPYVISLKAEVVNPWYVRLTDCRLLNSAELTRVRQYSPGEDWLALVKDLRKKN